MRDLGKHRQCECLRRAAARGGPDRAPDSGQRRLVEALFKEPFEPCVARLQSTLRADVKRAAVQGFVEKGDLPFVIVEQQNGGRPFVGDRQVRTPAEGKIALLDRMKLES